VFIATSTFEWFPGVQIHHSRDLAHWRLAARPLARASQLDMRGDPDSCGVWAPDLSHADGRFWLVYTDVKRFGQSTLNGATGVTLRDFHNYLVTCDQIDGVWSDPVYLNSSGFDPRCSTTTTGAAGCSTCSGTIDRTGHASPASSSRNWIAPPAP
jgi:xylan 1,4-beta-xylosidase